MASHSSTTFVRRPIWSSPPSSTTLRQQPTPTTTPPTPPTPPPATRQNGGAVIRRRYFLSLSLSLSPLHKAEIDLKTNTKKKKYITTKEIRASHNLLWIGVTGHRFLFPPLKPKKKVEKKQKKTRLKLGTSRLKKKPLLLITSLKNRSNRYSRNMEQKSMEYH